MNRNLESPAPSITTAGRRPPLRFAAGQGAALASGTLSSPLHILVVEDEPLIGMLLAELLVEMGHDVCAVVSDEAGAVAAAALHEPDLMIVDATLGRGSGVRAVDTANLTRRVRHFFTTGDALKVRLIKPDALVLQKPFDENDLANAIARAVAA
jgi:CheY-like chemotaxis protein